MHAPQLPYMQLPKGAHLSLPGFADIYHLEKVYVWDRTSNRMYSGGIFSGYFGRNSEVRM